MRKVIALLIGICLCLCLGFCLAEEGMLVEEQPGSDPADDAGLTLALDQGDREFNVYTGSKELHLDFWNIQDYDTLSKAWGGAPGWSVVPDEGSAGTIVWTNDQVTGKSMWFLYGTGETAVAGDYSAVLTCTWHGQSVSARITIHVADAPNGPLESIIVPEEEYTLTVGDSLTVNLEKSPAGWTLPGETEKLLLNSVRSGIEEDFTYTDNGDPYIYVSLGDPLGTVNITAWRSGTYNIHLKYECGSFTEWASINVRVLNPDGTLPEKAEDVTELEDVRQAAVKQSEMTGGKESVESGEPATGQVEAEEPGGDPADDAGLTLALDKGDQEFTIYEGSEQCHLSFWNILNYEALSAAWGGEPGWSVTPAEGSGDVIRWSNASRDGKSIWAFYSGGQTAEAGDYAAVLTCTWHGQSASATVKVHVVASPNGALNGITGLEENYEMALGDTLSIDLQTDPAGWTLPGETGKLTLNSVYSETEDEYNHHDRGNPFFNINAGQPLGPVSVSAWRSGVYRLRFSYRCGSFTKDLETVITVRNEDGSVPQTAEEITELETAQWSYDTGVNQQTGEEYAILTGGRALTNLEIPAQVDGLPVRVIGERAFTSSGDLSGTEKIETLVIPEGVVLIDRFAFSGCVNLKSVTLPDTLLSIAYGAFRDCRSLSDLRLPAGLKFGYIEQGAFDGIALQDVVLSDGTSLLEKSLQGSSTYFSSYADGWHYQKLEDGTARLTELVDRDWSAEEIVIPDTVGGLPVSTLVENLFYGNSNLRKVTLPESLKVIEGNVFRNCISLKEVSLPAGLQRVGAGAFVNIAAENLALPEGARENSDELWYTGLLRIDGTGGFEYGLLEDKTAVVTRILVSGNTVAVPAELDGVPVTGIAQASNESRDWESLKKVTEISLPDGLKFIGIDAFSGFSGIKKADIPETVTVIGREAFSGCSSLTSVRLPEGLRKIGDGAFRYCPLTEVKLPESLVSIGNDAFTGHRMNEIEIPRNVTAVGYRAFNPNGGNAPKKVTFCNPQTAIGVCLFGYVQPGSDPYDDPSFITLEGFGRTWYSSPDTPDNWKDMYADPGFNNHDVITVACFPGSTADMKYQYNVTKEYLTWGEEYIRTAPAERVLGPGLYSADETVYELIIPEGVEEIAEGAFANMKTLCKVTLPSSLKTIGNRAFEGCGALAEITLPDGVTSLGEGVFKDCVSLKKAVLPAAVTDIPDSLFENCENLADLQVRAANLTRIGNYAFKRCGKLAKLDLKKGLTEIGTEALYGTGLKKAAIPDTVTSLGSGAFAFSKIEGISLPAGLEEVPENLCCGAAYLTDIKIPAGVTKIGPAAFAYCRPSSLKLPEGLVSIGDKAFLGDTNYVQACYVQTRGKQTVYSLKSLKLPASLKEIGKDAFTSNDALTSVSFAKGSQLELLDDYAFAMCVRLKEIALPGSVQRVGDGAFVNCIAMKKADLGSSVVSIGTQAFMYDEKLTSLRVPDTASELGEKILEGHGPNLTVICGEGSAMETYVKNTAPDVKITRPKSK